MPEDKRQTVRRVRPIGARHRTRVRWCGRGSFTRILVAAWAALALLAPAAGICAPDFVGAWKAYQAAVARKAPAEELLPLAQAVYDALPARPADAKQQRLKAAAAFNLGAALRDLGESDKAYERFRESLDLFEAALGKDAPELVDPLWELARLERWLGDGPRASARLVDRIDGILASLGEDGFGLRFALHLEWAFQFTSDNEAAPARKHIDWLERHADRAGDRRAVVEGDIALLRGKLAFGRRSYADAIPFFLQARERYLAVLPPADPRVMGADELLVVTYEELGRSDEATPYCLEIGRHRPIQPGRPFIPLYRPPSEVPDRALRAGVSGVVELELTVTATGRPADIRVVRAEPSGYFEEAAIAAVKRFRYAPRFAGGEPVDTPYVRYTLTFSVAK